MHVAQTAGTLPKDGASNFPIIGCSANMLAAPIAIVSDAIPTKAHEAGGACLSAPPLDAGEMPGSADEESILIATTFQEKVFASEGACSNSRDRGYLQKRHRLDFSKGCPTQIIPSSRKSRIRRKIIQFAILHPLQKEFPAAPFLSRPLDRRSLAFHHGLYWTSSEGFYGIRSMNLLLHRLFPSEDTAHQCHPRFPRTNRFATTGNLILGD